MQTCHSTQTHYPNSEPTSHCSYSFMLHAEPRCSKYQFYSLWLDLTEAWSHNLPHSRPACWPLHHRCISWIAGIKCTNVHGFKCIDRCKSTYMYHTGTLSKWQQICSVCQNHNMILSSFMTYHLYVAIVCPSSNLWLRITPLHLQTFSDKLMNCL